MLKIQRHHLFHFESLEFLETDRFETRTFRAKFANLEKN